MGAEPKLSTSSKGKQMHYSVGALIEHNGKYLLVDRVKKPLGFACIAGHIDKGENETTALIREVKEESGLTITKFRQVFEEEIDHSPETGSRGIGVHYWYVFICEIANPEAAQVKPDEANSIGWFSREEISRLTLEPVWRYWLGKVGVL